MPCLNQLSLLTIFGEEEFIIALILVCSTKWHLLLTWRIAFNLLVILNDINCTIEAKLLSSDNWRCSEKLFFVGAYFKQSYQTISYNASSCPVDKTIPRSNFTYSRSPCQKPIRARILNMKKHLYVARLIHL